MNLIRWEPFSAVDDMVNRFPAWFARWPRLPASALETGADWAPSVDISETKDEYLIRASLPGVKKDDAKVTVADGMLTLSSDRQQQEEHKDEKFHKVESFYGSYSRNFALPDGVDENAIRADSKDGVLTVHVPKAKIETKKPTTIKVQ
jgi:HSP20 family protein